MPEPGAQWTWKLTPNHWTDLSLSDGGLVYSGTNVEHGPPKNMRPEVVEQVRAAVEALDGQHHVVVVIAGEAPDELHLTFADSSQIKHGTRVVHRTGAGARSGACAAGG